VPEPTGYHHSHAKPTRRPDCEIGVGFSTSGREITQFLVDLQYTESFAPTNYTQIARIDHNPSATRGHDIRSQGIHVDALQKSGPDIKFFPTHSHVPHDLGTVIRACAQYFENNTDFFVDLYEGRNSPSNAPRWSP
jgi:hypothetical protein